MGASRDKLNLHSCVGTALLPRVLLHCRESAKKLPRLENCRAVETVIQAGVSWRVGVGVGVWYVCKIGVCFLLSLPFVCSRGALGWDGLIVQRWEKLLWLVTGASTGNNCPSTTVAGIGLLSNLAPPGAVLRLWLEDPLRV